MCQHSNGLKYCKIHDVAYCEDCKTEYGAPMFRYEMPTPSGAFYFRIPTGTSPNRHPKGVRMMPGHETHA